MKVRVNMSVLQRDIRGKTAEGKRGEMLMHSTRAGAHSPIRHDIRADTVRRSVVEGNICSVNNAYDLSTEKTITH